MFHVTVRFFYSFYSYWKFLCRYQSLSMACWENDLISVLVWHRIKWKTKRIIEVFHLLVGLWYCGRCEGQTRVPLSVYVINIVSKQHSHSHIVNAFVQVFVQVASAQVAMTLKYLTFSILLSALALRTKVNYTIAFSTPDKPFQFQSRVAHNDVLRNSIRFI